jgi:hypothetical protein
VIQIVCRPYTTGVLGRLVGQADRQGRQGAEQMGKFLDHVATQRLGGCFALTLLGFAP